MVMERWDDQQWVQNVRMAEGHLPGALCLAHTRPPMTQHPPVAHHPPPEVGRHCPVEAGHPRQLLLSGTPVWGGEVPRQGRPHAGHPGHQPPAAAQHHPAPGPGRHHGRLCCPGTVPQLHGSNRRHTHPHRGPGPLSSPLCQPKGLLLGSPAGPGGPLGTLHEHLCGVVRQGSRCLSFLQLQPVCPAGGGHLFPPPGVSGG